NRIFGSMRLDLLQKGRLKDLCNPNSEGFIPFFISTGLKYRIFYLNLPDGEDKMHLGNESKNFVFCFALHSVFIIFANQKQNHATSRTL
ncbi:MAG: hypothetical protein IKQ77_01510, partial [Prevotella sp.]|nr:hypothetical protein [Prevotella sp.]